MSGAEHLMMTLCPISDATTVEIINRIHTAGVHAQRPKKPAVILNGAFEALRQWRSEESLTVRGRGGLVRYARVLSRRLRPFSVSDSSLRSGRKASRNSVQNDDYFIDRSARSGART